MYLARAGSRAYCTDYNYDVRKLLPVVVVVVQRAEKPAGKSRQRPSTGIYALLLEFRFLFTAQCQPKNKF